MRKAPGVRWLLGAVISGGLTGAVTYGVVGAVWPSEDLDSYLISVGLSAIMGAQMAGFQGQPTDALWPWHALMIGLGFASLATTLAGVGAVFGEPSLATLEQRVVFGTGLMVLTAVFVLLRPPRPAPVDESEVEARREAIRENIRREIAEMERDGSGGPTAS